MNTRLGIFAFGVITFFVVRPAPAQTDLGSPPSELRFMLEYQTASTNREKCGFEAFVDPCPAKAIMYKHQTTDWGGFNTWRKLDPGGIGEGGTTSFYPHEEESCANPCFNWSGTYNNTTWDNYSHQNSTNSYSCTLINCDQWDNNGFTFDCGSDCNPVETTTTNVSFFGCSWSHTNDVGGSIDESSCTNYTVYTRSDEYTTPELLSSSGLEYSGDWMSGSPTQPAFTSISDMEKRAVLQKMQYRFKLIAPPFQHYKFQYYVHYLVEGSTNEIISTNIVSGIGTGSWTYYGPIEIAPPYGTYTNGNCVYTIGAKKWVTVPASCGISANFLDRGAVGATHHDALAKASSGTRHFFKASNAMVCSSTCRKLVRCSLPSGTVCRSCSVIPGSVSAELADYGVWIRANLGSDSFGEGSGSLAVAGATPQANMVTPAGLEYFGTLGSAELIRNSDGSLRQAKSGQVLADIVVNSGTSYTISCYSSSQVGSKDQNGLYTPSGTPLSTATIAQGSSTNEILVTVSTGVIYDYTWSASDGGWTLTSGGGLRRETRSWNPTALVRTNTIRDANNQVVYQEIQYLKNLDSWGSVMTKQVVGPQGPALTTQWFYYEDPQADGTNYGKVKMRIEPSGFWTRYEYNASGWITREISQFRNAATNAPENQCRIVLHDYTPVVANCVCELRTEQLLGQEIARQYTLNYGSETVTIQCQTPGTTNLNAADNLVTVSRNYHDGGFVGKLWSVRHPDGTVQVYTYDTNDTQMTTMVLSGQPDASGTNVVDGTLSVTVTGLAGDVVSRTVTDIASSGTITSQDTYSYNDDVNRSYTGRHYNGTSEQVQYACCGIDWTSDADGTVTQYIYDALKRQVATTRNGITTSNFLDAAGHVLATVRIGNDASQMLLHQAAYDTAGRLTAETNALNGVTLYSWSFDVAGQTIKTSINPDGGTRVETSFQDGTLAKLGGTAANAIRYEYGVESEGGFQRAYTREIKLDANGNDTPEWTKSYTDLVGRSYKMLYADGASSWSLFNTQGQRWKHVDPDGVTTLYQYNAKGELEYTAIDLNTNGVIDFAGADRITRNVSDVLLDNDNGYYVRRTRTYVWGTTNQDTSVLTSTTETALNAVRTWTSNFGLTTDTQTTFGDGQRWVTSYAPDRSYTVTTFRDGQVVSVERHDANGGWLSQVSYGYDAHGRQTQISELRSDSSTVTNTIWFNAADQQSATLTPSPDGIHPGQMTTNYFDTMCRIWKSTLADNTSVTNEYFPSGLLKRTYGSRTYPVAYTYDAQGRMTTMTTWQGFVANSGIATTVWRYDPYRGWLTGKTYTDGQGPSYTYTAAGRLKTRRWARGITTTYGYDNGLLSTAAYSDSTPAVGYGYDRRGRQTTITQGAITTTRAYDDAGNLLTESYSGGRLAGLSVTNGYDQFLRRTNLVLRQSSTPLVQQSFTYDTASRLKSARNNSGSTAYSATYTYLANSSLVDQIDFARDDTGVMSTFKQYDYLNRLTSISSSTNGQQSFLSSFGYQLNNANQCTAITNADGSFWVYGYDHLGQVTSGRKYWADGTAVAGEQFTYSFDDIGNRTTAGSGGDTSGANLRTQSYSANPLNQYRQRTVPGYVQVLGRANSNSVVSLWGSDGSYAVACQQADYFRAELAQNNRTGAVWLTLTNNAVLANGGTSDILTNNIGNAFLAHTPESYGYDADGNLTSDGRWAYTWDAENRLSSMQSLSSTPAASRLRLDFAYDYQGRRIQKVLSVWISSTYVAQSTNRFVYDEWNLLGTLDGSLSLQNSLLWGLDLSGSTQGAGGVGGLLGVSQVSSGQSACHFVAYDGNGNVAVLVSAGDGTISAQYEYGPFGEILRATGLLARANPFRFSTKYQDDDTDLLYYGYRYYNASTGRWLSRDPIAERGGKDLYTLLMNEPISRVDYLGLADPWPGYPSGPWGPGLPVSPPQSPPFVTYATVVWFQESLDQLLRNIPCCCQPKYPLQFSLSGTASGSTVTGHAHPNDNLKSDCVYAVIYWWWTCYNAYHQGPDNTRNQGWSVGSETFSDTETPSALDPISIDPYHIAMEAAATVIMCDGQHLRAIRIGASNGLQWSWDKRGKAWGNIEQY